MAGYGKMGVAVGCAVGHDEASKKSRVVASSLGRSRRGGDHLILP